MHLHPRAAAEAYGPEAALLCQPLEPVRPACAGPLDHGHHSRGVSPRLRGKF